MPWLHGGDMLQAPECRGIWSLLRLPTEASRVLKCLSRSLFRLTTNFKGVELVQWADQSNRDSRKYTITYASLSHTPHPRRRTPGPRLHKIWSPLYLGNKQPAHPHHLESQKRGK
jgi:hypothetical protein